MDPGTNGCAAMCDWFTLTDENDTVVGGICVAPGPLEQRGTVDTAEREARRFLGKLEPAEP